MNANANTHIHAQIRATSSQRLTLLVLATPISVEGLPMGDAFLFSNTREAEQYMESKPLLRDRDIFDTLLIPCRYGRG